MPGRDRINGHTASNGVPGCPTVAYAPLDLGRLRIVQGQNYADGRGHNSGWVPIGLYGTLDLLFCGVLWLSFAINLYAGVLSALTICVYVFAYTPIKRVTTLNTIVGAIPGALPPVIGWTVARGHVGFESWRNPRFCTIVKKAESLEVPAIIAVGGLEPSKRIFEFFTVPIRNKNPDG